MDYSKHKEMDGNKIWLRRTTYDYMASEEEPDIHDYTPRYYDRSYQESGYAKSKSGAKESSNTSQRGMSSTAFSYEASGGKRKLNIESEEKAKATPRTIRKFAKISATEALEWSAWTREYPKIDVLQG